MSTVIWALSPHPPLLIPEVGGASLERVHHTRQGMEQMCRAVAASRPERLVLVTPHGPVHPRAVPLFLTDRLTGNLGRFGHPEVAIQVEVDRDLSLALLQAARDRDVTMLPLDPGEAASRGVPMELDHALMVPLYYLQQAGVRVPTVVMSISWLPGSDHLRLGEALRDVLRACPHRVAVLASGDLSHRLLDSGPYGFDEMGPVFDRQILECLKKADGPGVLALPEDLVERAGQCGMRPILTLLGSLEPGARAVVHSYEGPFGVGYAVVHFEVPPDAAESPEGGQTPENDPVASSSQPDVRLVVARQAVEEYVLKGRHLVLDEPVPEEVRAPAAAFVTLKSHGDLRGCIGTLLPTCANQLQEVARNAVSACSRDPRFPPVTPQELPDLTYQVYILGAPQPVAGLEDLDPQRYGVIVRKHGRSGVLLPALEGVDTPQVQVAIACRKAGIEPGENPDLERFEVRTWSESPDPS